MNDPHVNSIRYAFKADDDLFSDHCQPVVFQGPDYQITLKDKILTCVFKSHFSKVSDAKAYLEPMLKSWIVDTGLQSGQELMRFDYIDADVTDRNPSLPGPANMASTIEGISLTSVRCTAKLLTVRSSYPAPPLDFSLTSDVEILWSRYKIYLQEREPLPSMAYFCLSRVEGLAGGRYQIPAKYAISKEVLDKLGELTSEKGDKINARKGKNLNFTPFSAIETRWIEECVRKMIRRLGEYARDASLSIITMKDLPKF